MLTDNPTLLLLSLVFASVLLGLGYFFGRRQPRTGFVPSGMIPPLVDEDDRQRMVGLLQSLARWTHEYSDNVSDYQSNLEEISQDVRRNLALVHRENQSAGPTGSETVGVNEARMLNMLTQVMTTNEKLQERLDAAEQQLAEQTNQIESYLTEARTDGLTGLFNRRAFDKKFDEIFASYRGGGGSFVLILVDIDHFKIINDTHGHPVGDVVLQRIASQLSSLLTDAEMVARFGGEEFAILTRSPLRTAAQQINQIRSQIADEPIQAGNQSVSVTMSVGLSEPRDELVIGPIVRRADAALYCAKNRGRDRVYFDDGSGPHLFGAPEVTRS